MWSEYLKSSCIELVKELKGKPIFKDFVNPIRFEGYTDVVRHPMSLYDIEKRIKKGKINSLEKFDHDMMLIFNNCKLFNGEGIWTDIANFAENTYRKKLTKIQESPELTWIFRVHKTIVEISACTSRMMELEKKANN